MLTPAVRIHALMPTHSIDTMSHGPVLSSTSATANAWPAADLAIYVPIAVPITVVVRKLWFASGATGTGNYDLGLYNDAGTRLLARGSTAKPAAITEEVWDCTDTTIGPGIYYLALVCSNNTDTFYADTDAAPMYAGAGLITESLGSTALPATATWAVDQTLACYPYMGLLLEATVA